MAKKVTITVEFDFDLDEMQKSENEDFKNLAKIITQDNSLNQYMSYNAANLVFKELFNMSGEVYAVDIFKYGTHES